MTAPETGSDTIGEIGDSRWAWAMHIPVLPDSLVDESVFAVEVAQRAYLNLAEAVAVTAPRKSAIQLRLQTAGARDDRLGTVHAWVLGAANSHADAQTLLELVRSTLPGDLSPDEVRASRVAPPFRFVGVGDGRPRFAEVRRRLEDADVVRSTFASGHVGIAAVLDWAPERYALRKTVEMLSRQRGRAAIALHMEPAIPTAELIDHLSSTLQTLRFDPDRVADELSTQIMRETISAIRELPRSALRLRIGIASAQVLLPGLAESIGMDLTALGAFLVSEPRGFDVYHAERLWNFAEAVDWGFPTDGGSVVAEMLQLSAPASAGRVIRFPQPPVGGLPAIASAPLSTLPRSPQRRIFAVDSSGGSANDANSTITLAYGMTGGTVELSLREINQHILVAGLPGFGKTTTVQHLLRSLWLQHRIPFLVLDPAKTDYGSLADELSEQGAEHVQLGPGSPAFNPFVVPTGTDPSAHAARVLGAFDASLRLSESWPFGHMLLTRAMYRLYEDAEVIPTLRDLYRVVGETIRGSEFSAQVKNDLEGSLLGRLESFVRGPLGAAFTAGPNAGIDWDHLLKVPTVIEFKNFAAPTERSLVFALLIAGLASYRESHQPKGQLAHLTVLEEAHRVLAQRAGAQSEGVRLLVEAVAELRGSGEGFVICDQAPSTLDPALRKITGSLICHRVVDSEERSLLGDALLLHDRQADDLARLEVGTAVVYGAQRSQSVVARVHPPQRIVGPRKLVTRTTLGRTAEVAPLFCIGCPSICDGLDYAREQLARRRSGVDDDQIVNELFALRRNDQIRDVDIWCTSGHLLAESPEAANPRVFFRSLATLRKHITAARQTAGN